MEWDDLQKCSEGKEQYGEEDDRACAWLVGRVASEEWVSHTGGHKKERLLPGHQEKDNASSQKQTTLKAAQRLDSLATVKHPDRNEVEQIQPRAGVGKSGEDGTLSCNVERHADAGGKKAGKRAGECNLGAAGEGDFEALPANERSQARKENGQIGFEAKAFDGDDVTKLVNENGERKSGSEPETVDGPVDTEESGEAKQEFEFEEEQEGSLGLRKQDGERSEGAEAFDPLRLWLWLAGIVDACVEGEDSLTNPFGLTRSAR